MLPISVLCNYPHSLQLALRCNFVVGVLGFAFQMCQKPDGVLVVQSVLNIHVHNEQKRTSAKLR